MFHDHRLFFRQFRENFHTTGSIAPSSRWLARALARFVAAGESANRHPRRILEVGPGTGAVTHWILPALAAQDRLDLVEMNDQFVAHLRLRFQNEPAWQAFQPRTRILHQGVQDLTPDGGYDAIVSGLPLNNFSGELVEQLLATLTGLLAPGGTLSFFEYVAVRQAKLLIARGDERTRLRAISQHLGRLLGTHEFRRDCVLRNVPPAWVHHVCVGSKRL
ncbi:MAG TPA: methyltransferase [Pirellulales bacterium]|nr:methyltransferase [Pirellulales bacterium]